jgi:vacuolar protein sorting-associated protein 11
MLDIETAIDVCKDSKNIDCAMELAKKTNHTDQYLRILIENKEDYCTALDLIHDQSDYSHKLGFLKMYGPVLLKNVPDYTYDMIKMLAQSIVIQKNQDSRSQVFHLRDLKALSEIFVDDKVNHRRFLEFLIKNDESAEKEVFHSLIELYLQDYYQYYQKHAQTIKKRITPDNVYLEMKDNLISFIREKKERFDKKHVLMLFQMYNFSQGIKELCQMLELKQELMTYYMQKKDYTNIMNICIEYGKKVPFFQFYFIIFCAFRKIIYGFKL